MRTNPNSLERTFTINGVKEEGEEWIKAIVLKAIGNLNDDDCEFEVQYEDESEPLLVKLYEDFENGDLAIIWPVLLILI